VIRDWKGKAWLLPPVLVGLVLRFWNLLSQILSDDELHAVRAAVEHPLGEILTTYQKVDNSIPITAFLRLVMNAGGTLNEMTIRLPALVCGVILLIAAPLWAERRVGRGPAIAFACLLAISPCLVFYTRIARSYSPIVLLGFGAVVAFDSWWRHGGWRRGAAYVVLAALAVWFHLGAAPLVASPFLFAAGALLVRRDLRKLRSVVALGVAAVLALLIFLIPARASLIDLVQDKHEPLSISGTEISEVAQLQAGSGHAWVAALVWLVALAGLARLARRAPQLAALTATAVAGHIAGILFLSPMGHQDALILNRYLLVILPWVLLWAGEALGAPWPVSFRWQPTMPAMVAIVAVLLVGLFAAGPFTDPELRRTSFAHHNDFLRFFAPRPRLGPRKLPPFYRDLGMASDAEQVLECPWVPVWSVNRAFYLYQEAHGRKVVVAPARGLLIDPRLVFRNMVPGTPEGMLASRARWLVVHRNLFAEEQRLGPVVADTQLRRLLRFVPRRLARELTAQWGPPDVVDPRILVWDLARVRGRR
jgi:hypothetical protein